MKKYNWSYEDRMNKEIVGHEIYEQREVNTKWTVSKKDETPGSNGTSVVRKDVGHNKPKQIGLAIFCFTFTNNLIIISIIGNLYWGLLFL